MNMQQFILKSNQPSEPSPGQAYFDTKHKAIFVYDGKKFIQLLTNDEIAEIFKTLPKERK